MAEQQVYNRIPANDLERVYLDVMNGVSVDHSDVEYTDDMKSVRPEIESWYANLPAGAVAELPKL